MGLRPGLPVYHMGMDPFTWSPRYVGAHNLTMENEKVSGFFYNDEFTHIIITSPLCSGS